MAVKKGQVLELDIIDVVFGGSGLARVDGLAVFVDHTVPGDRVQARVYKKKKNYAMASVIEIDHPSPFRVQPPCAYSGMCGGCKWQFLDYEKQLEYKRAHVSESIEHIGLIKGVTVHPAVPSELIYGYRNKMEFSCSDRRWLMPDELGQEGIDRGFALGLHVPGTFHKVLDTRKCLLMPEEGNQILNDIRRYMQTSGIPVYGLRSHVGFWRFVMLRHSAAYDQWLVNIITSSEDRNAVQPLADKLTETYPRIVAVVNNITSRKAGIAIGEYEILLAGNPTLRDRIGSLEFEISANSFFQTNSRGAERLYSIVKSYAELTGRESVLDLYCGTGTIAICLADSAAQVTGIELVESAVIDARKNAQLNGVSNCHFVQGDIADVLGDRQRSPEVMIIDPPRAGMHKNVVRHVLNMAPERIVYVSCNPATMARDMGMLKERYRMLEVQPVDMFPHTFHVESVAKLDRIE